MKEQQIGNLVHICVWWIAVAIHLQVLGKFQPANSCRRFKTLLEDEETHSTTLSKGSIKADRDNMILLSRKEVTVETEVENWENLIEENRNVAKIDLEIERKLKH